MRISLLAGGVVLLAAQSAWANSAQIEEVVVLGKQDSRHYELAQTLDVAPDTASILKKVVGANVVSNGPLTGIAQYRGMSRFRVSTQINGSIISAGGPNWMDPPLSYAPVAHLESIEVLRGITSVSAGAETIGGAIRASTWQGEFSDRGPRISGRLRGGTHSANSSTLFSGAVVFANASTLLRVSALSEQGNDADFADGTVRPTEYQRQRYDVGVGLRRGAHTWRMDWGHNETGDSGTPALAMDISSIDADLFSVSWSYAGVAWDMEARLYHSEIEHGMTNYHLRQAPAAGSMWRRNVARGDNTGFSLALSIDDWRMGINAHYEQHNSDIDNPNIGMFFVTNFNDARRRLLSAYVEQDLQWGPAWSMELGGRLNHVRLDAGAVDATPAMMGMPAAAALRDGFNQADRDSIDQLFDWAAKLRYQVSDRLSWYSGITRKSRAPAYQEKYSWLPLQATAGLADGRTYTGNLQLDAEVAHEVEFGLDWEGQRFSVAPRVFYRSIDDYIQGTDSSQIPAFMFVQMMNAMNGTANAAPLQFNNVDAVFYGFDVDWRVELNDRWSAEGVLNFVRGERDDVDDHLYRLAAPNAFVALNYRRDRWQLAVEGFVYGAQDRVAAFNQETASAGYGLINLKAAWQLREGVRIGAGIDNLADRRYVDHLTGVYRVNGDADLAWGERIPGLGRSVFARLDINW